MTVDPWTVVQDFVTSPDPKLRRNALTALAAMGNRASISQLIERALSDEDHSVTQRARDEILDLDENSARHAVSELTGAVEESKKGWKIAYAILGSLRSVGHTVPVPKVGWLSRIRQVWSLGARKHPILGKRKLTRAVGPSLLGGAIASAIWVAYLGLANMADWTENAFGITVFAMFLALVMGPLVSWRTRAANQQFDPVAGAFVDMAWAAGLTYVGFFVLLAIATFEDNWVMLLTVGAPLSVAAVRAGTLMGLGVTNEPRRHRVAQVAIGGAAGFVVLTVATLLAGPANGAGAVWGIGVPVMFALANVFAKIDGTSIPSVPLLRGLARPISGTVVGVMVVPMTLVLIPEPTTRLERGGEQRPWEATARDSTLSRTIPLDRLPSTVFVVADFPQRIEAYIPGEDRMAGTDYVLTLLDQSGARIDRGDDPPRVASDVRKGNYRIVADQFGGAEMRLEAAPFEMWRHLKHFLSAEPESGLQLVLALNVGAEYRPSAGVQDTVPGRVEDLTPSRIEELVLQLIEEGAATPFARFFEGGDALAQFVEKFGANEFFQDDVAFLQGEELISCADPNRLGTCEVTRFGRQVLEAYQRRSRVQE